MHWKVTKTWRVVVVVLVLLVCFRLALPYIITRHVNNVLNQLDGYHGNVADVDLHLFKSTYNIDTIRLYRDHASQPFMIAEIPMTEITIDWPSVFKGNFGSEVTFNEPSINITEKMGDHNASRPDWLSVTRKLSPIAVSRIRVNAGQITYKDKATKLTLLQNIQLDALNLNEQTQEKSDELPSRVYLQALSIGNGQLNVAMKLNLISETPHLDLDFRLEKIEMEALNKLLGPKADINVQHGKFNLFGEISSFEGNITGFVKPIFTDLDLATRANDDQTTEGLWVSLVNLLQEAHVQQRNSEFATRISIEGELQSSNSPFVPALWNIFSNALIATTSEYDNDKQFVSGSASTTSEKEESKIEEPKSKKEERRQRRREKREDRKKQKREKNGK